MDGQPCGIWGRLNDEEQKIDCGGVTDSPMPNSELREAELID